MDGLLRWEQELRSRDLTVMVYATGPVLETYPQVFKRLAQRGHEVIGGYSGVCWDCESAPNIDPLESPANALTFNRKYQGEGVTRGAGPDPGLVGV